jgi:Asp-tRNA(Asn)/Glu-tRNA(Gln) amidotransferase A subunit family amidase
MKKNNFPCGFLKMDTAPRLRRFILLIVPAILFLCASIGCRATPAPKQYQAPANAEAVSGRPIVFMTASELAEAIRSGRLTSLEVVSAHIDHIHKYNPGLNAIVFIDEKAALERARQADEALARGEIWGPLHGVPVSIKDHFAVKGMRITNAFPPLADQVTNFDATVVKRLRDAGAIILGITNMPVMAMDVQTSNPIYGRTNNPWDATRTTGGSTGGGAAAVASGMSPLTIGSDLAGSIRIPSAFCGIYGIKPTDARFFMYTMGGLERRRSPLLQMVYPATYDKFIEECSRREILIAHLEQFLMEWDVFICPVTTRPAYKHIEPDDVIFGYNIYRAPIPVDDHQLNYWTANAAYTSPFNTTGHPAVTLPAGYSEDGMPIGLQIVGRRWHDMELLDVAEMIDTVAGDYREPAGY